MPAQSPRKRIPLCDRDPSDPVRQAVELAQRGRMILDVSALDLEVAEARLGAFHPTTWHFRNALNEAGNYQNHHRVYDRAGHVCRRCGRAEIIRIVLAQRSTFFCPTCQPLRRSSSGGRPK